jgi:hypothetical protein
MPLALTDEQLDIIRNFAEPLNPHDRSAYLQRVAALLGDREARRRDRQPHGTASASRIPEIAGGQWPTV